MGVKVGVVKIGGLRSGGKVGVVKVGGLNSGD